ncbi:MAG: ABC transporter ATP-binding protein, partial [Chromatiales bacterium]
FEGEGVVREYVGGYGDWLRQRSARAPEPAPSKSRTPPSRERPPPPARKLSYKDQRELDELPRRIESLEAEQAELHARMGEPAFFRRDGAAIARAQARLAELEEALAAAYERWEHLEQRTG